MVELKIGLRTVDLPYTVRVPDVTEEMFDELVDEDTKAELFDGVMIVHSPASLRHDYVAGFLRPLLRCYAEEKGLGRVLGPDSLIHLATCRLFAPDVYFVEQGRLPQQLQSTQFEGAPDLVVEVLSPSNRTYDLNDKRPAYRQAGVKEIWFIDPEGQQVIVDRRRRKSYATITQTNGRVISTVLAGFWVDAGWLWAEPLPNVMPCLRQIQE